jgi:hypothetical protein
MGDTENQMMINEIVAEVPDIAEPKAVHLEIKQVGKKDEIEPSLGTQTQKDMSVTGRLLMSPRSEEINYDKLMEYRIKSHPRKVNGKPYGCFDVICRSGSGCNLCCCFLEGKELIRYSLGIALYFRFLKYFCYLFTFFTIVSFPFLYFFSYNYFYNYSYSTNSVFLQLSEFLGSTTLGGFGKHTTVCEVVDDQNSSFDIACTSGTIRKFDGDLTLYGIVSETDSCSYLSAVGPPQFLLILFGCSGLFGLIVISKMQMQLLRHSPTATAKRNALSHFLIAFSTRLVWKSTEKRMTTQAST